MFSQCYKYIKNKHNYNSLKEIFIGNNLFLWLIYANFMPINSQISVLLFKTTDVNIFTTTYIQQYTYNKFLVNKIYYKLNLKK